MDLLDLVTLHLWLKSRFNRWSIEGTHSVREKRTVDCSNRIVNAVGVEWLLSEPKSKLADASNTRLAAYLPPE